MLEREKIILSFGSMSQQLVEWFLEHISIKFEMSLVGELTYFLCLQVRQTNSGTFISQAKYGRNLVSKFRLGSAKHKRILIGTHKKIARDEAWNGVD